MSPEAKRLIDDLNRVADMPHGEVPGKPPRHEKTRVSWVSVLCVLAVAGMLLLYHWTLAVGWLAFVFFRSGVFYDVEVIRVRR